MSAKMTLHGSNCLMMTQALLKLSSASERQHLSALVVMVTTSACGLGLSWKNPVSCCSHVQKQIRTKVEVGLRGTLIVKSNGRVPVLK